MSAKRAAIVYNPVKAPLERIRRSLRAAEEANGWAPTGWYETDAGDSGRRAAEDALASGPAVILVAGGDGTVRAVAEVVQGTGTPLAIVPAGTGNLLVRNLGLPLNDVDGSVAAAFGGATRAIDVALAETEDEEGRRTSHVFLVMAGIGLDADMAANTNAVAKRYLGWLAYVPPIARSIMNHRLFHLHYRIDDGRAGSARAHTVILGNCGTLTGNMLLIPDAKVDDGMLDVVMLRPKGRFGWAGIGTRLSIQGIAHRSRFGRAAISLVPDLKALAYARGRRFEARFDVPHAIQLDGDGFGTMVRARISVRPGALEICTRGGEVGARP